MAVVPSVKFPPTHLIRASYGSIYGCVSSHMEHSLQRRIGYHFRRQNSHLQCSSCFDGNRSCSAEWGRFSFLSSFMFFGQTKSTFEPLFDRLVGSWICDILASGRVKKQQGFAAAMACVFWSLHLRACGCCLCNWPFRKSYVSSNQQRDFTLLCRSDAGEYFGCLDCFPMRFCYSRHHIAADRQR
ncbi:uncharacterized protein LOC110868750 isoform X1 [Helianthus annuus]|uniref:Uncharacterized protein n=1 Tax=Helianthus annuus TaxID=4232 RepID=A0A251UCK0_HELAN|nr:uncharacterized protein LOC110868750 isoform X1 [Helianthus annuus]